ncbi:MAG: RNA-binding protein [Acidobacteria bacterium]|nr:MAG: RNA-binding protein [Acidobacteriota bacterium]PYU47382.1 MAG: RNA-binding protein [Acidobacteriota bacterium]PYU76709.1 MAG: RNA-binding protein [Acidobacteriota bacterium]
MMISRRKFLAFLATSLAASRSHGQGVASRNVPAQPRGKPSGIPFLARFTDITRTAGLRYPTIYGPTDHKDYIIETVGCGCAFLDYDNDGWVDVVVLSGSRVSGAPEGTSNRLYKNNRDGTFTDVTERAGLLRTGWASAVTVGDYNNDGFDDLFITSYGQNTLYRNNGDGTFSDVTKQAGLLDSQVRWGAGCSFVDYNLDGHLDLFVSNYLEFDFAHTRKPGEDSNCQWKSVPVNCGPRGLPFSRHSLYRNNGDGTFTEVSEQAGIARVAPGYGMTVVAADFDNDGWPDVYIACDSTPSLLFRNKHDGTFEEVALLCGAALSQDGMEQAGMGVGIGDVTLNGRLDIFKTHFADDTNILYLNDGQGNFEDHTIQSGLGVETRFVGWGAGIVDLDNDGNPDLFFVTGNVYPEVESKVPAYPFKTPRVIFRNLGGAKFEELLDAGPGISEVHASRGCAFGDFDNDGDVDVLIVNLNEPPSLLRNDLKGNNHWLKLKLVGSRSNRTAIGARVTCSYGKKRQAQEVIAQSSFYSCNDQRLHFGLGNAATANLDIRWPSGTKQSIANVKADQILTVREPTARSKPE